MKTFRKLNVNVTKTVNLNVSLTGVWHDEFESECQLSTEIKDWVWIWVWCEHATATLRVEPNLAGHQGMEPSIAECQILKYPEVHWTVFTTGKFKIGTLVILGLGHWQQATGCIASEKQPRNSARRVCLFSCSANSWDCQHSTEETHQLFSPAPWNSSAKINPSKIGCPGSLGHPILHYHILTHILTVWGC